MNLIVVGSLLREHQYNNSMNTVKKNELPKDITEFVDTFMEKVRDKQLNYQVIDAVRDMLIHKLVKEGWTKQH
jgi:hypothetical protein